MKYEHTQTGYLMIWIVILVAALFGYIIYVSEFNLFMTLFMIAILLVVASFLSLKVTINKKYLIIKFGIGIYSKQFLLKEIISAKAVKNKWIYGWGIRKGPNMWIYNVSGYDAVEIKMKNGKIYRIGTDEPQKLKNALTESIK